MANASVHTGEPDLIKDAFHQAVGSLHMVALVCVCMCDVYELLTDVLAHMWCINIDLGMDVV